MSDHFEFKHFLEAQEQVYPAVIGELRSGKKTGHWSWYIFPQLAGLGSSSMSRRYSIATIKEASAYFAHPILGSRLVECTELLIAIENRSAEQILGHIDALKFRSCMTLFAAATHNAQIFRKAIDHFFGGIPDALTSQALEETGCG